MSDTNGDVHSIKLGYRACRSCDREHPKEHLLDGWCPQCRASSAEELALAYAEAPQRYRRVAQDWRERGMTEQADELEAYVVRLESVRGDVA